MKSLFLILLFLTLTSQETAKKEAIKIYLEGGASFSVDEVTVTLDGFWYRRGNLSLFMEKDRVRRIVQGARTIYASPAVGSELLVTENLTRLPRGFLGEKDAVVYGILSRNRKTLTKSQFETTGEYKARIQKVLAGIKFPSGKEADKEITLLVPGVKFSYDADTRTGTFTKEEASCSLYKSLITHYSEGVADNDLALFDDISLKCAAMELSSTSRSRGYATGQNAFGVKVRYSISEVTSFLLAMPSDQTRPLSERLSFEVDRVRARQIANGPLLFAISGFLTYPYFAYDSDYKKPTIDSPTEVSVDNYYIILKPTKVRVYNSATGEVFALLELKPPAGAK